MCRNYGISDLHVLASLPDGDEKKESLERADRVITACFLEGGIVFHSIFVGINYGISENDSTSIALLIALIFHQVISASPVAVSKRIIPCVLTDLT